MGYEPSPWPRHDPDEVEAAAQVLASGLVNYWTGTEGRDFEREFAAAIGSDYAVFVANGTVALELAIGALALPSGSHVVTTPRTFIASSSAIVTQGLVPVFADVDPDTGNITAESVAAALTPETSAVLVVHLGGWPADAPALRALCDEHGLKLIEDCSQAHGAMIGDRHVGTFGDVATWSFCQDKIISTGGEGGMVATNDETLWRAMWQQKDHGKSWEAVYEREHPPGFRWLHDSFGTNGRGTEVQGAIGRLQYRKLPGWTAERTKNAEHLAKRLATIPGLRVPTPTDGQTHAYYRLYAYVDLPRLAPGWDRDRIIAEVRSRHGVEVFSGSCGEIYLERAFVDAGLTPAERLPQARRLGLESLAFLVHPGLTSDFLDAVADAVGDVMHDAVTPTHGE